MTYSAEYPLPISEDPEAPGHRRFSRLATRSSGIVLAGLVVATGTLGWPRSTAPESEVVPSSSERFARFQDAALSVARDIDPSTSVAYYPPDYRVNFLNYSVVVTLPNQRLKFIGQQPELAQADGYTSIGLAQRAILEAKVAYADSIDRNDN